MHPDLAVLVGAPRALRVFAHVACLFDHGTRSAAAPQHAWPVGARPAIMRTVDALYRLEAVVLLLGAVLVLMAIARRVLIPYPIFLVIGGLDPRLRARRPVRGGSIPRSSS